MDRRTFIRVAAGSAVAFAGTPLLAAVPAPPWKAIARFWDEQHKRWLMDVVHCRIRPLADGCELSATMNCKRPARVSKWRLAIDERSALALGRFDEATMVPGDKLTVKTRITVGLPVHEKNDLMRFLGKWKAAVTI